MAPFLGEVQSLPQPVGRFSRVVRFGAETRESIEPYHGFFALHPEAHENEGKIRNIEALRPHKISREHVEKKYAMVENALCTISHCTVVKKNYA